MDAETLTGLRAIVDGHRIRILGRLATRPTDPETLARDLRLPVDVVRKQLEVLAQAGLVEASADQPGAFGRAWIASACWVASWPRSIASGPSSAIGLRNNGCPPGSSQRLECTLELRLEPTGDVVEGSVRVVAGKGSGNAAFDASAVSAVYKASPLPVPTGSAFDMLRHFQFRFRP